MGFIGVWEQRGLLLAGHLLAHLFLGLLLLLLLLLEGKVLLYYNIIV